MANYPFVMLPAKIFTEDLSGSDFKVIGVLASYTNADRICHVFTKTIEKRTGLSRRSVFNALNKLEGLGYIKRQNDYNRSFQANFYYIDFNPQPSAENCTTLVQENTQPSAENCTYINKEELNLNELDIKTKFLNRRSAQFSKNEEGNFKDEVEITPEDKEILNVFKADFDDVAIWNKLYKSKHGLFIKPVSSLGARNTEPARVDDLIERVYDNFGVMIHEVPAGSNDNGAREII